MVGGQEDIARRFEELRVRSEPLRRQHAALAGTFAVLKIENEVLKARFRAIHPLALSLTAVCDQDCDHGQATPRNNITRETKCLRGDGLRDGR